MMSANSTMGNRINPVTTLVACVGASWHVASVPQSSRIVNNADVLEIE